MKYAFPVLFALFSAHAWADDIKIPSKFEPVLFCAADLGNPDFKVARSTDGEEIYFLAALVHGKTKMIELEIDDADMGYVTYVAKNERDLGSLARNFRSVSVHNDEEDIDMEAGEKSYITRGRIRISDRRIDDQECEPIGKPQHFYN